MSLDTRDTPGEFGTTSDTLGDLFYPLYTRLFDEESNFVAEVETKLAQARMTDTVEMYLSRALGMGVIGGGALWMVGTAIAYLLSVTGILSEDTVSLGIPISNEVLLAVIELIKVPVMILLIGVVLGSIGFITSFGVFVGIPYSRASTRKRQINMLLTDAVSFMYALSVGGLNQLEILEAMAKAEDTYGEVAKEFQSIVQETEYFDIDYRTAIRKQAIETPSDELSQFLTDMLSIINSGGNMRSFLEDKKEKHMRTAKQQQELTLETLELFGEMYMTLSLFPLLLIIILVIMQMLGQDTADLLYMTVYALIPLIGIGFLVLISTVKQDETGDGYLSSDEGDDRIQRAQEKGLLNLGLVESFTGTYSIFDRIKDREGTYETMVVLKQPHVFFRDNPLYTLALTVPAVLVLVVTAMVSGSAPTSWGELIDRPVWGTFMYIYLPLYIVALPLAIFWEWNIRSRRSVVKTLSDDLRKLSSANDTGMTLLESLRSVSETTTGKLPREFEVMHTKVNYGMSLNEALIEFNNKYHIPRLARTVKLISKAQEASSQITDVLTTAARASENHDDIERDRISRTRMQVVIIIMTFITLLAVMAILKMQFIDVMAGLETGGDGTSEAASQIGPGGGGFADAVDTNELSLLFFHAVTLQGILSGIISGYVREADVLSGLKFSLVLATVALVVWAMVA